MIKSCHTEADIMRQIQIAVCESGARLFRNNVGLARQQDGRIIRFGMGVGSADLVGFTPKIINGNKIAVFTAIEVKHKGKPTKQQLSFLSMVRDFGGIAGVAHSIEEALIIIGGSPYELR